MCVTTCLQVVAVLNGVGAILGIEEDLLGATVLAWGETLPDLVAMLAVARAGGSPSPPLSASEIEQAILQICSLQHCGLPAGPDILSARPRKTTWPWDSTCSGGPP